MFKLRTWGALAGAAVAAVSVLSVAAPAQAAQSIVRYANSGKCMGVADGSIQTNQPVSMLTCSGTKTEWRVAVLDSDFNGHQLARLQNVATGLCMDTLAHVADQPMYTHACNTGDYQYIEVYSPTTSTRVFKSYAAYYDQGGKNLCLQNVSSIVDLENCTSGASQTFTRTQIS